MKQGLSLKIVKVIFSLLLRESRFALLPPPLPLPPLARWPLLPPLASLPPLPTRGLLVWPHA